MPIGVRDGLPSSQAVQRTAGVIPKQHQANNTASIRTAIKRARNAREVNQSAILATDRRLRSGGERESREESERSEMKIATKERGDFAKERLPVSGQTE